MSENTKSGARLSENLKTIHGRVQAALRTSTKAACEPVIIAVTKGHTCDAIRELYALGIRNFAESYVQEFVSKHSELRDLSDINWHFVGVLQSNKAKKILHTNCLIHSLDRLSLFQALSRHVSPEHPVRVLVQLQVDPLDSNKSGCDLDEAKKLCELLVSNPGFNWQGFMGIGPFGATDEQLQSLYRKFSDKAELLWEEFSLRHPSRELRTMTLSLGMSDDLETAIACGSTHIRVGTALLGPRAPKNQAT